MRELISAQSTAVMATSTKTSSDGDAPKISYKRLEVRGLAQKIGNLGFLFSWKIGPALLTLTGIQTPHFRRGTYSEYWLV